MRITTAREHSYRSALYATLAALLIPVGVSRADVKIISEVTVTGGPSQDQLRMPRSPQEAVPSNNAPGQPPVKPATPKTATTYYKGKMVRAEVQGGPATIYDGDAGKVYILHPDQKTYSVLSVAQMMEQLSAPLRQNAPNGGRQRNARFDAKVKLEKSDATKTIAGKDARKYVVTASMEMSRRGGGFRGGGGSRRGGGFPRRGGFPGGGGFPLEGDSPGGGPGGGSLPGGAGMSPPSVQLQGEYWLADAALLPEGNRSPLPLLQQTVSVGPILKELNNQLVKMKLVPLSSRVTVTMALPNAESQEPLVATMEVKAITEESLDGALFKVPADYKEMKPDDSSAPR